MKKLISIITILLLLISTACNSGTPSKNTSSDSTVSKEASFVSDPNLNALGQTPICKEKKTLTIGLPQGWNVTEYYNNTFTKRVEEFANVKLEFKVIPSGSDEKEAKEKLALMISAGGNDLPDVWAGTLEDTTTYKYGQLGMFVPLDDYYKNSAYYLTQQLKTVDKDLLKYVKSPDGHFYGLFRYNEAYQNEIYTHFHIYKPWVDALGRKLPTTLDDFCSILREFRDKDMNNDGDTKDEIPLVGSTAWGGNTFDEMLMSSFIECNPDKNYMYIKGGKIDVSYDKDAFKTGLKYIANMVSEGLLDPVSYTQDDKQMKVLFNSQKVIMGADVSAGYGLSNPKRDHDYVTLTSLKGPDGAINNIYCPTTPTMTWFVTKNCKNPELAFRIGDFLMSTEMTIWNRWGEKGVQWKDPGTDDVCQLAEAGFKPLMTIIDNIWSKPTNVHWSQFGPGFRKAEVGGGVSVKAGTLYPNQILSVKQLADYRTYNSKEPIYKIMYTAEEIEQIADIEANLKTYVQENMALFITGVKKVDKDWDAYVRELDKIGLKTYLKVAQTALDRMSK